MAKHSPEPWHVDVTAEEMEQAIENARTAVFRDPPWSPNARAFLAILTERDQLNAEVAALRRQVEERGDVVTVPRDRLTELVRRFLELAEIAGQIKALAKSDERHIQDAQFRALRSGEAGTKEGSV